MKRKFCIKQSSNFYIKTYIQKIFLASSWQCPQIESHVRCS